MKALYGAAVLIPTLLAGASAFASPMSDSMTVFTLNQAGNRVTQGQVAATEDDETKNGVNSVYVLKQNWGNSAKAGFTNATLVTEAGGTTSDLFGVVTGQFGCPALNFCLAFVSDNDVTSPAFPKPPTVVPEGNGVFDATSYLDPGLVAKGWHAEFASVPEPPGIIVITAGLGGLALLRRRLASTGG